jgi:hypothetical protein
VQLGAGAGLGVGVVPRAAWTTVAAVPPVRTSALRSPPVFGCTCSDSVALPWPEESASVSHAAVVDACHRQPVGVVSPMVIVPPVASIE